jgi:hypothetical protein
MLVEREVRSDGRICKWENSCFYLDLVYGLLEDEKRSGTIWSPRTDMQTVERQLQEPRRPTLGVLVVLHDVMYIDILICCGFLESESQVVY